MYLSEFVLKTHLPRAVHSLYWYISFPCLLQEWIYSVCSVALPKETVLKGRTLSPLPGQWLGNGTLKCHHLSGLSGAQQCPSSCPGAWEFLGAVISVQGDPCSVLGTAAVPTVCGGCGIPLKGIPWFNGMLWSWVLTLWCCHALLIQSLWKESVSPLFTVPCRKDNQHKYL